MANNSGGVSNLGADFPSVGSEDFNMDPNDGKVSNVDLDKIKDDPKEDKGESEEGKETNVDRPTETEDTTGQTDKDPKKGDSDDDESSKKEENSDELLEDEEGNIINEKGEVVIKKDDVKRDEDGNVIVPDDDDDSEYMNNIVSKVAGKFGVELKDEKGNPKKYDGTDEGLAALVEDLTKTVVAESDDSVFKKYPPMEDYLNHLMAGGQPDDYFKHVQETSTQKYELPKDDVKNESANAARKAILREEQLIKNGYYKTEDTNAKAAILNRANKHVERIADSGEDELVEEAKLAKTSIDGINAAAREAKAAADKQILEQRLAEQNKYIDNIKATVKAQKLHSVKIPEKDIESFTDYITKPVDAKGNTQEMLDVASEDLNKSLELAYMRFKGFDLDKLVELRANEDKVNALRLRKAKPVTVAGGKRKQRPGKANLDDITIDRLTG